MDDVLLLPWDVVDNRLYRTENNLAIMPIQATFLAVFK
jgi:hypothetical protein